MMIDTACSRAIQEAYDDRYAIPAFNFWNIESVQAFVDAAEKEHSPVILSAHESLWDVVSLESYSALVRAAAKRATVPVFLHLDHGSTVEVVATCIRAGFDSVMIDGASLSLSRNVETTRKVVEMARAGSVLVEGAIGKTQGRHTKRIEPFKTDPKSVQYFVPRTTVDLLAVSVGNVSGTPDGKSRLDMDLLERIAQASPVPLVLHGGTGVPDKEARRAISLGVCKINIGTIMFRTYLREVVKVLRTERFEGAPSSSAMDLLFAKRRTKSSLEQVARRKMKTFGSSGKA
jgi:ketose-bisphosphate aldolase